MAKSMASVLIGLACHLRQMSDAQDLPRLSQPFQQTPHYFRHAAADTAIDFVENQGRDRRRA